MALKDIFKMTKANRYTADGREELIKAQEAETEDRRYNIGEISEKTGLQKTANGWVKPKNGKQPGAKTGPGKSPEGGKEDLPDFIKGFSIVSEEHDQDTRAANAKLYPSLQPLVRQREPFMKKRIEAFTKLRDNPGNPKARADFVDATNAINQIDADIDRAYKKASSEAAEKPKTEKKSTLKLPDEKSSFSTDVNRMKKLKKEDYKQYTIQLEKLHSKYPINKWKDLYNKTLNDSAPHVLTGDTRIRVRK